METRLILKNLDNGTITRDAAIELLTENSHPRYIIGAYLETRNQRDQYRRELHAVQDAHRNHEIVSHQVVALIDHALDTDHISIGQALSLLECIGMDETTREHHVDTICAIRDRDFERVEYLDNPDTTTRYCTRCGRKTTAKKISTRGICYECGLGAQADNNMQIREHKGPYYRKWRDAMLKYCYTLENEEIAEIRDAAPADHFQNADRQIENDHTDKLPF